MSTTLTRYLVAAVLTLGAVVGLAPSPAAAAPHDPAPATFQTVQYYGRGYYRGPPRGYYGRPYAGRGYYGGPPRYYARPYYGRRYYR